MGKRYVQRYCGDEYEVGRVYIDRCCDCGLVHDIHMRIVGGKQVFLTVARNERRTAASRRSRKYVCKKVRTPRAR